MLTCIELARQRARHSNKGHKQGSMTASICILSMPYSDGDMLWRDRLSCGQASYEATHELHVEPMPMIQHAVCQAMQMCEGLTASQSA